MAHYKFHPLDWVCGLRRTIHVHGQCRRKTCGLHQDRLRSHASDRETNACQIEISAHDLAAHYLYKEEAK